MHPQLLLEKAQKEPRSNLDQLVNQLSDDSCSQWRNYPSILRLYFHQFNPDPPSASNPDPVLLKVAISPMLAFRGLHTLFPLRAFASEFKQLCELHWPNMWKWIRALYRRHLRSHPSVPDLDCMLEGILLRITEDRMDPSIAATRGLLGLSFAIHLHLASTPTAVDAASRLQSSCNILDRLLKSANVDLNEIRKEVGYYPRKAARTLFYPAFSCLQSSLFIESFPSILNLHLQIIKKSPEFYQSFSSEIVMSSICNCIAFVIDNHNSHSIQQLSELSEPIISVMLGFLILYLNGSTGHAWVRYGLRHDLLPLIMKSASLLPIRDPAIRGIAYLLDIIRTHSIHPSVIKELHDTKPIKIPSDTDHPRIRASWNDLLAAATWATDMLDKSKSMQFGTVPGCRSPEVIIVVSKAWKQNFGNAVAAVGRCTALRYARGMIGDVIETIVYGKDLLKSTNRTMFFHFLMSREMENTEFIKKKIREYRKKSPQRKSHLLLLDLTGRLPPPSAQVLPLPRAELPDVCLERDPVLLPCLKVRFGEEVHMIIIGLEMSIQTFGLLD
ncbi:hypothetical protein H0H93_002927 [Arthromyces matolae]|nr:hypothetical protein H0H93_002927 [Arthromyces matolae]